MTDETKERFHIRAMAACAASAKARSRRSVAFDSRVLPTILALRAEEVSYEDIARQLNLAGERTPRGRPYLAITVHRMVRRHRMRSGGSESPIAGEGV